MTSSNLTGAMASFAYMFAPWANHWGGRATSVAPALLPAPAGDARRHAAGVELRHLRAPCTWRPATRSRRSPAAGPCRRRACTSWRCAITSTSRSSRSTGIWLRKGALHGDLGISIALRAERLGRSSRRGSGRPPALVLYASIIIMVIGIGHRSVVRTATGAPRHRHRRRHGRLGGDPVIRGGDHPDPPVRREARVVPRRSATAPVSWTTSVTSPCRRSRWRSPRSRSWRASPGLGP